MVGSSLIASEHPVVLRDADSASGLADMLHQYLEQSLTESPGKVALARAISGQLVFRAREDESVCVLLAFDHERIEVRDIAEAPPGAPAVSADFLTVAHLTSGEESPFSALRERKLSLRFSLSQLPFLLRVALLLRLEPEEPEGAERTVGAAILVIALVLGLWLLVRR